MIGIHQEIEYSFNLQKDLEGFHDKYHFSLGTSSHSMMILRLKEHQALQRNLKVPRVQKGVRSVAKMAPDDLTIDHV